MVALMLIHRGQSYLRIIFVTLCKSRSMKYGRTTKHTMAFYCSSQALLNALYCAGYVYPGFANNKDLSSQLGLIVVLEDNYGSVAIIHHGSWKCHIATRSVIGVEIYASSHCLFLFLH